MSLERAESTISVDRPVFPLDADGRVFERWHEAVGFTTRVRRVPRSECRGRPYDADGHMLMPVSPRIGEVPALLARLMRESPPDRLSELAVRRLSATLDDAIDSLASRIARSERPRPLKRAMGRYRRLSEALALRADPDTAWRERELSWEDAESAETTVRLLDDRIARACLETFFEVFAAHARRMLVSSAMNFTRAESDAIARADRDIGRETFFRCERSELRVRPVRLADIFGLPSAVARDDTDTDRVVRSLVLEIAAYPWESDGDGANGGVPFMLAEKRMGCVGKSLLLHAFLDYLGIGHRALDMFDHSAVMAYGPLGRSYLDPVNFVSPVPMSAHPSTIGSYGYESLYIHELPAPMRAVRSMPASTGITAQMLANIAVEYARSRQYRDALALLDTARSLAPGSAALLGLSGRVARLSGDGALARRYLELAVELCPQDVRSSRELAGMLIAEGRYSRAKTLYSGVVAHEGAPAGAWYDYGVACAYDRDDDRAIDAFDRVLADEPDDTRALDLRFHVVRTIALERGRRFQAGE